MAIKMKSILILSILLFLICFKATASDSKPVEKVEEDEDLSFLEDEDDNDAVSHHHDSYGSHEHEHEDEHDHDFENYDDLNDDDAPSSYGGDDAEYDDGPAEPKEVVDEKDVVVLSGSNFTEFIGKNKYVMVEFYAPWCGHCESLKPEYAAAATELKGGEEAVVLAKVDATEESELSQKYGVEGYPSVFFFVDGVHKTFNGERNKEAIVAWVKKKTGPGLTNLTSTEEAKKILATEKTVALGFLTSLVGSESNELAAASQLEDEVEFYQTTSADVAKLFHIDPEVKQPALVVIKKEAEKINHFGGEFTKSAIAEFVSANKLPLVINLTRESAPSVFENPIKKQLILFTTSNDSAKFLPAFKEAVQAFKGKVLSVYVELDNEDVGKPVSEYFGVNEVIPSVLAYTGNEDARKFILEGEITLDSIKSFGEKFLEDNLKPFYKSEPIPDKNDGNVKIVVGNNFDEIVLDESKDVLLEIYAPWCGHCQSLEPIYNKLAKHLKSINSLVIAKMDGTTNEHPRAKADGYPTILFFPAGNKSFDPITVDTDRTVVAYYKFIKKHASIPFKLEKPVKKETVHEPEYVIESHESDESSELKDEL